jgi:hypothetical protein
MLSSEIQKNLAKIFHSGQNQLILSKFITQTIAGILIVMLSILYLASIPNRGIAAYEQ